MEVLNQPLSPCDATASFSFLMSSSLSFGRLMSSVIFSILPLNAGPVVAGVVGQERYQFDIWGDTVNVAARMLDKSEPGTVAVTERICDQISAQFEAEDLGPLDIKGKGMISVFGIRPKHHRAPVHVGDGT